MVKAFLLSCGEHGWEREWVGTSSRNLAHRVDGRTLCCSLSVSVTVTKGRLVSDLLVAIVMVNPLSGSVSLLAHSVKTAPGTTSAMSGVLEVQMVLALVPKPFRTHMTQVAVSCLTVTLVSVSPQPTYNAGSKLHENVSEYSRSTQIILLSPKPTCSGWSKI